MLTVTVNPSIDIQAFVPVVEPERKLHCEDPQVAPGGGGINVARVVHRFGVPVLALFAAGGQTGASLRALVEGEGVPVATVRIAEPTRESITVKERTTGRQFRFVLPGPRFSADEAQALLSAVKRQASSHEYVVISGSLPPGIDPSYIGCLMQGVRPRNAKIVVDTSGPALVEAARVGAFLLKPSVQELSEAVGRPLVTLTDVEHAARELQQLGTTRIVLASLGERGALLVEDGQDTLFMTAPPAKVASVIGAGDSLVAGVMVGLEHGWDIARSVRHGVAAAAATVGRPGSHLCEAGDVNGNLYGQVIITEFASLSMEERNT